MDREDIMEIIASAVCWGGLIFMAFMGFVIF